MLYDLLNEVVVTVLGPTGTMSRFRREIINSSLLPPSRERKLLDRAWEIFRAYLHLPHESLHTLEEVLCFEIQASTPWQVRIDDEVNALGNKMECLIIGDLVKEIVNDMVW